MDVARDDADRARRLRNEARLLREPLRLAAHAPRLVRRTRRPAPVVVLPGYGATDASTIPLRWYLRRIGHDVEGWELGRHQRHVARTIGRFTERLEGFVQGHERAATLVGWSLGGVIAREVARARRDLVEQVITLGTPIAGFRRSARHIGVPVTVVHSKHDGIVDWRTAIDHETPGVVNLEVGSSHAGLGIDPDVWRIIADTIEGFDAPPPTSAARHD